MAFNGLGDKRRALRPPGSSNEEVAKLKKKMKIFHIYTQKKEVLVFFKTKTY